MNTGRKSTNLQGFTLPELLIVVAIVGITLAIAVPSFQALIAGNRLTASANSLVSALQLAKSEAIKRNRLVMVSNTAVANNNAWENGWVVFADLDQNSAQAADGTEPTIGSFEAMNGGFAVKNAAVDAITYRPDGRSNTTASFYFCSPAKIADFRRVVIENSGRVRVETPNTESSNPKKTYATAC